MVGTQSGRNVLGLSRVACKQGFIPRCSEHENSVIRGPNWLQGLPPELLSRILEYLIPAAPTVTDRSSAQHPADFGRLIRVSKIVSLSALEIMYRRHSRPLLMHIKCTREDQTTINLFGVEYGPNCENITRGGDESMQPISRMTKGEKVLDGLQQFAYVTLRLSLAPSDTHKAEGTLLESYVIVRIVLKALLP